MLPGGDDNKTRRSAVQGCPEVLTKAGEGGEEGPPEAHNHQKTIAPFCHSTKQVKDKVLQRSIAHESLQSVDKDAAFAGISV